MFIESSRVFLLLAAFGAVSSSAYAEHAHEPISTGTVSGSIGAVSKYIYRGGVENDDIAIQAGLTYEHQSGFQLAYWGSTLDYDPTDESRDSGFEHDFSVGYAKQLNDDWAYSTQLVAYVYQNGGTVQVDEDKRRSTAVELTGNLSYRNLALGTAVAVADSAAANAGDVYLNAAYSYALPQDFSFNTAVGISLYNSSRDDAVVDTSEHFVFSEARAGISKQLTSADAEVSLDYIWGGKTRAGENLEDHAVLGLNFKF